jgi:SMI1 / KNR4 family (SUKH-1)
VAGRSLPAPTAAFERLVMLDRTFQELAGLRLKDEDGNEQTIELQPPASEAEIRALEARVPGTIPDDVRNALRVTKGLANGPLESFSLVDLEGFGLEEMLPDAYSIAHDGYGNYWVLDLLPGMRKWEPVFYACHDPPVLAYQSATIEEFLRDTIAMWQGGPRSRVDYVHEDVVNRIWQENPNLSTPAALPDSADGVLRDFAASLPPTALVVDLRHPALGQGFSWGRFGPRTSIRRAGQERIWAIIPPERKRGFFASLFR